MSRGRVPAALATAAALAWVFLLAWPYLRGAVLVADDVGLLYVHLDPPAYFHPWSAALFRPLEIAGSFLLDPAGRSALPMLPLHLPALAAVFGALWWGLRRLGADVAVAFPVAALWLAANVGTSVSLWQPDTLNQTWSAAAGLVLLMLLDRAATRARAGTPGPADLAAVAAVTLIGVASKELFYGWCLGGLGLLAVRARTRRALPVAVTVVMVAAGFALARLVTGGLGDLLAAEPAYSPRAGANVVTNLAVAALGVTNLGPTHVATDPAAPLAARALPAVGSLATMALIALPSAGRGGSDRLTTVVGGLALALSGLVVAIPVEQVSEHYTFGPNVIVAGLVGLGVAHAVGRAHLLAATAALTAVLVGAAGLASRAAHFDLTWSHVRAIDRTVTAQLEATPGDARVVLPARYAQGLRHNIYVLPPAEAYGVRATELYLDRRDPTRSVRIELGP